MSAPDRTLRANRIVSLAQAKDPSSLGGRLLTSAWYADGTGVVVLPFKTVRTRPFLHSLARSLTHSLTRSLTHSFVHSLTQFHFTHDYAIHNVFNGVETANYTAIDIDYEADARVVAALTDAASGAASSHVYVFDFEQRYVPTHSLTHPPTRSLTHPLAHSRTRSPTDIIGAGE